MYDVRCACQAFYGDSLRQERDVVRSAFLRLLNALPEPLSQQEA
jgi:hypothetical protein